ncbi:O-antigen polysaccharide polymerase Wzy [Bacillus paranthracis]|uniref:O-antigen polysaccharide polymerase Wzy n=1 Tax=Bacillus paranthracis TaxID=2026186 RepID=UPI0035567119
MEFNYNKTHSNKFILFYRNFLCIYMDIIFAFLFVTFVFCSVNGSNENVLYWLLYATYFNIILYLIIKGVKDNISFFLFAVAFFTFLMGSKLFFFININEKNIFTLFIKTELNSKDYILFVSLLFFSLTSSYIAYRMAKFLQGKKKIENKSVDFSKYAKMKGIIKFLFPIFLMACLIEAYMSWRYIGNVGYVDSYVQNIKIPIFISKPAALFPALILIFCALEPKRDEIKLATKYYFISLICTVFTGRRTDLVIGILFIVWYLCVVDNRQIFNKKFLTNRRMVLLGSGTLLFISFLGAFSFIRAEVQANSLSIMDYINFFFTSLGRSDSVVADTIIYQDVFPKNGINYLFYPIKDFLSSNIFTRGIYELLTGLQNYTSVGQGLSKLSLTDSFSHWLTYIVAPSLYIKGHGLGSSFISETFIAFGLTGVIVYSAILGILLSSLLGSSVQSLRRKILLMVIFKSILFAPRGPALGFIDNLYEIVLTYILLYFVSLIFTKAKGVYSGEQIR